MKVLGTGRFWSGVGKSMTKGLLIASTPAYATMGVLVGFLQSPCDGDRLAHLADRVQNSPAGRTALKAALTRYEWPSEWRLIRIRQQVDQAMDRETVSRVRQKILAE